MSDKRSMFIIVIWYILGVCSMLPWNFFITADSFWQYKLRNVSAGNDWEDVELTHLQVSFTPTLVIISNLSLFFFSFATSAMTQRMKESLRIYGSLWTSLAAMGAVTLLAIVNSDDWQKAFYGITMTLIAFLNIGIALLQGSLYGLAGLFPGTCMNALYSGQAVAGVLSSFAMVLSLGIGDADPVISGIIYFVIADCFILLSIALYYKLTKTDLYKSCKVEDKQKVEVEKSENWRDYVRVFKKVYLVGFTMGFVLCVTLAVFPAVTVYISSSMPNSTWTDVYFQPVITFLIFNIFDVVGREITRWIKWPNHDGWLLHILSASRIIFIPLLLLCNGDDKTFPTVFYNDAFYIIFNILFALSNGYFGTLALIYYPRFVTEEETELGGTIMQSLMCLGLIIGSAASPGFVALWGPIT